MMAYSIVFKRALSFIIDVFLLIPLYLLFLIIHISGKISFSTELQLVILFVIPFFYFMFMEWKFEGGTIGKNIFKLHLTKHNNSRLFLYEISLRIFIWLFAPIIFILFYEAIISIFGNTYMLKEIGLSLRIFCFILIPISVLVGKNIGIHDLLSNTVISYKNEKIAQNITKKYWINILLTILLCLIISICISFYYNYLFFKKVDKQSSSYEESRIEKNNDIRFEVSNTISLDTSKIIPNSELYFQKDIQFAYYKYLDESYKKEYSFNESPKSNLNETINSFNFDLLFKFIITTNLKGWLSRDFKLEINNIVINKIVSDFLDMKFQKKFPNEINTILVDVDYIISYDFLFYSFELRRKNIIGVKYDYHIEMQEGSFNHEGEYNVKGSFTVSPEVLLDAEPDLNYQLAFGFSPYL